MSTKHCVILLTLFACNRNIEKNTGTDQIRSEIQYSNNLLTLNYKTTGANFILKSELLNLKESATNGSVNISTVFTPKTVLVRYLNNGCNSCLDLFLNTLKTDSNHLISKRYKVIILADYQDHNTFFKWYKMTETNFPYYSFETGSLSTDTLKNSYAFTVDESMKLKTIFVPISIFPNYGAIYLKAIE